VDFAVLPPEINSARMYAAAGAGPMVAAAASFAAWMSAAAAQDERTANQLSSAIAAYDATFVATMPPVEIEVNRAWMSTLLATNLFGQNASLIAVTRCDTPACGRRIPRQRTAMPDRRRPRPD
jgi:PPE-repeat protein